jgi:hypothetical protein
VLKISTHIEDTVTVLKLEGKIAGPWVEELESIWQATDRSRPVRVLLETVTFIDREGKKLLGRMHAAGAVLAAEECMTKAIVEEITQRFHR